MELHVTDKDLAEISRLISADVMAQIATNYLGLHKVHLEREQGETEWKFNNTLLNYWKSTKRTPTRKKLAEPFEKAFNDGLLDNTKVLEILGRDQDTILQRSPELKDAKLQRLAGMISHREELRVLATKGLNVEDYVTEYHFAQHRDNIKAAAYSLLKDWVGQQPNRKVAYARLSKALKSVNMAYYVTEVLDDN